MWYGWPLHRVILLFTGLAFLLISAQVTMYHWRQNFRHIAMWSPVLAGPILGIGSLLLSFSNLPLLRIVMLWLFWFGVLSGLYGTILHANGVRQRVGGYSESQNILIGPPLVLPAMVSAISVLGLLALYWR